MLLFQFEDLGSGLLDEMDRTVANRPDGPFERFLTSAIATILTLIFSWRFLLEADDINQKALEDLGANKRRREYLDPDDIDDDAKPYTARASASADDTSLSSNKRNESETSSIHGPSESKLDALLPDCTARRSQAVADGGCKAENNTSALRVRTAGEEASACLHSFTAAFHTSAGRPEITDNDLLSACAVSKPNNSASNKRATLSKSHRGDEEAGVGSHRRSEAMQGIEASADDSYCHGGVVDGNIDTNTPLSTRARPRVDIKPTCNTGEETLHSSSPEQSADDTSATGKQASSKQLPDTKGAKPGYFRPNLPLKWLDDDFDDDDVFLTADDNSSKKRCLPGDLAELSSVPHHKLKEFEKFLASEDLAENQLGAKLLEQYLLHEAHLDDSSESDYCDFNRTLDTITEEDTSDLDTSDSDDGVAKINRKRSTNSRKHLLREKRDGESMSTDKQGSLSKASSLDDADATSMVSDPQSEMTCDTCPSTSDSGSIDVRLDNIDSGGDSTHRYAQIKPQRTLIIGPYQDRDSAFSKEHFIDTGGNGLADKDKSISGDSTCPESDKDSTPGSELQVEGNNGANSSATPASLSCLVTGDKTKEIDTESIGSTTTPASIQSHADDSQQSSKQAHIEKDTNEVETDASRHTISNDTVYVERQNPDHPSGAIATSEQGVTGKSIIHEKMEARERATFNGGHTSFSGVAISDTIAENCGSKEQIESGTVDVSGRIVKPLGACPLQGESGLHNEVNTGERQPMMDSNSQVEEPPMTIEESECIAGSAAGSRPSEPADGVHRHLNPAGGGSARDLKHDKQASNISEQTSTASNASSLNDPDLSIFAGHQLESSSSSPNDSDSNDLRDRQESTVPIGGGSVQHFALASDQVIKPGESVNTKAVDGAKCTYQASTSHIPQEGGTCSVHEDYYTDVNTDTPTTSQHGSTESAATSVAPEFWPIQVRMHI